MRNSLKKKLKEIGFPLIIFLVVLIVSILNFQKGTFLSGWDTLHPEFDFPLNFKRLLWGVWREEQGLGAVAGHSHMADLPRVIILWLLHFIFPLNTLRYLYVFLCLFLGPLGTYFLIRKILKTRKNRDPIAFLVSLFYIFNLSTVQQFFVPFEMFPTQYAFLPWIILFSLKIIKKINKKNILLFIFISLFSTPQAYAAHLWYPFFAIYLLFLGLIWLTRKNKKVVFKRSFLLISLTLIINSFWLLPNLYFIKTSSNIPKESKQNRIFSEEFQLKNRENGYLKDVALIKGFYFDWNIYDFEEQKQIHLGERWNSHLDNILVKPIGYAFFLFVVLGFLTSLKKKETFPFLPFLVFPFVFLMNHTPPFEQLFNLLLKVSVLKEALRFVFTKFSILLVFGYSVYLAYFLELLFKKLKRKSLQGGLALLLITSLLCYALPMFQGYLISPRVKIKIPQSYFDFWSEMKNRENGRVLNLPLYNFTGWQYYHFGYQGAGFIWFGLKQPILDRDFDRWNPNNERAFQEFYFSLYTKNSYYLGNNLQKYRIKYILWDKNVITPRQKNQDQIVFFKEIGEVLEFLKKQGIVRSVKQFDSLELLEVAYPSGIAQSLEKIDHVSPSYERTFYDFANLQYQNYLTTSEKINYYPWRDYLSSDNRLNQDKIKIENPQENDWVVKLKENNLEEKPLGFSSSLTKQGKVQISSISTRQFNSRGIEIDAEELHNPSQQNLQLINNNNWLEFNSKNSQTGVSWENLNLSHSIGYIFGFKSKNVSGLPLRVCIKNLYNNLCTIYDELEPTTDWSWSYFPLPPMDEMKGFIISVDNLSFGDYQTKNILEKIVVIPFPFTELSKVNYQEELLSEQAVNAISQTPELEEIAPAFYKIKLKDNNDHLIFNQSFNKGWVAFCLESGRPFLLEKHFPANNWANYWNTKEAENKTLYIFFWPQFLELIGLVLLLGTLIKSFLMKGGDN